MVGMESTLSIIATIVSSVALIGVIAGLILQNRQVRANQIQVMREMHLELMKIGMDNPKLAASIYDDTSAEDFPRSSFLNFILKFWETGYGLNTLSRKSIEYQATRLFSSEYVRTYWKDALRTGFEADAETKSEKEFFMMVDSAFQNVTRSLELASGPDISTSSGKE
jgi:hypothetical protein